MSTAPPVPDNEAQRLQQLQDLMVLDTDSEPLFEHLVQWAAEVCGVPIALVSLVDAQRQWFKAQTGLPGVQQTPREHAFCAHAILDDGLLQVHDAQVDARFSTNPLVTGEPSIRFYAGAPLVLPGGERVGTLCVIDREPRQLDARQLQTLQRLARLATEALLMRRDLLQRSLAARSRYEQTLAQSEARHRALVEEQSELVSLAGPDGRLVYANTAFARHAGVPREALGGRALADFYAEDERALLQERIDWVLGTGQSLKAESRFGSPDGETWVAWTHSLQLQADGQRQLRSVGHEVTARRRAEAALRASQAFLQRTGRVAGVGGWQLDIASGQLTWSEQTRHIHEVASDYQPTLDTAIAFYAPEGRSQIEAAVQQSLASGQAWDLELPLVTAKGRAIWVRAVGETEFEDGPGGRRPVRMVGAFQDVTARKALEERLAQSERFVRQIADTVPVRIAYVDAQRRHRFVNRVVCERYGLPADQVLGRTRAELMGQAEDPELAARVTSVLAGQVQRYEWEDRLPDGQCLRIDSELSPDFDAQGRVQGYFATGVDVTERSHSEQALRVQTTLIERSSDFILQSSPSGELLYMNPAARRIVGLDADAPLQGLRALDFNTPETNRLIRQEMLPAVQREGVWRGETTVVAADGRHVPVSHLVIAHRDEREQLMRYSSVLRDISAEVAARQEAARQTATLRAITDALPVIVSALDHTLRYRFVNNAFEQWHGVRREQLLGRLAKDVLPSDEVQARLPWAKRALKGETVQFERHFAERPGQPTLSLSYVPIRMEGGRIDGFVAVGVDITPHRQEQGRLMSLAERDPLTGLLNRAGLQARLRAALASGQGPTLALLYIDLDRFKPVNDALGYRLGDRLLKAVAGRLAEQVMRDGDQVCRLGSDEFALMLPESGEEQALAMAQRVARAFELPLRLDDQTVDLSAAFGVACWPLHADDADHLLSRAEIAMHEAKRRTELAMVYESAMDPDSATTLSLLSELKRAIERDELRLFLQPKFALDGRMLGAEALVRWQHPVRGMVPPLAFIPFAEKTGFVRQLTTWIFDDAARQWPAMAAAGLQRVSVNLSARDLMDLGLPERLDGILAQRGVPATAFCLEITESAIMDDPARALNTLNALKARGFKLSIDDFGEGYTSLQHLRHLPVDELKVDGIFVKKMDQVPQDENVVRSVVDLAHNLGLSVVAEGVENAEVWRRLAAMGCDEAQGFFMCRPLPAAELGDFARLWAAERHLRVPVLPAEETALS